MTSSINLARPIFIVEGKDVTKINEINNIGYYEFSVKNFDESNTSEISFLYTIEVISDTDESVQFELYNEDTKIPLENLKTEEILIQGKERNEQKYQLKVIYDHTQGNRGKEILEEVQIKVHSQQEKI